LASAFRKGKEEAERADREAVARPRGGEDEARQGPQERDPGEDAVLAQEARRRLDSPQAGDLAQNKGIPEEAAPLQEVRNRSQAERKVRTRSQEGVLTQTQEHEAAAQPQADLGTRPEVLGLAKAADRREGIETAERDRGYQEEERRLRQEDRRPVSSTDQGRL